MAPGDPPSPGPGEPDSTTAMIPDGREILADSATAARLVELLEGRLLTTAEVESACNAAGIDIYPDVRDFLQIMALTGNVSLSPGVIINAGGRPVCQRCGSTQDIEMGDCPICGDWHCFRCTRCSTMGEIRACTLLYTSPAMDPGAEDERPRQVTVNPGFPLSDPQRHAAESLAAFARHGLPTHNSSNQQETPRECLLWAVCGAGKTEVAFQAIVSVLQSGGNVLYAVPRRDVVIDLADRFKNAFSGCSIAALYGGSRERLARADITLATTHQVIRFSDCFDLVVLDEVDAFPYHNSEMLHLAVKRACKPNGIMIYMSATPRGDIRRRAQQGNMNVVHLPARFHGHPLPVPELLKVGRSVHLPGRKQVPLPAPAARLIADVLHRPGRKLFVFVPTVDEADSLGRYLTRLYPGLTGFTYASDSRRDKIRRLFMQGPVRVLVTTTILERGITVANADVMVLRADNEWVFDEPTLVQMAGRCGRTPDYPSGHVWFIGKRINSSMRSARKTIIDMNELARKQGYLREKPGGPYNSNCSL